MKLLTPISVFYLDSSNIALLDLIGGSFCTWRVPTLSYSLFTWSLISNLIVLSGSGVQWEVSPLIRIIRIIGLASSITTYCAIEQPQQEPHRLSIPDCPLLSLLGDRCIRSTTQIRCS